ncbi:orotidine-5'-phosphate decarboxylase [Thermonema rossianum]|uniref:orotidine-5'-phosphate decarboxylase n=1 Tax=Thermonema rossianum TaxID=55505 RepID=UPI00056F4709|nr:orotidine-5'-phosphate decarboxylase [Thermonema rossianum]
MLYTELSALIQQKKSMLCVGLDADIRKIPAHLHSSPDPIFEFNKQIIDATYPYAVAYKPNLAFYEALGARGWDSLARTMEYMPKDVFRIADAKRGDIGNTAALYARTFFETLQFDAVTLSPYMGKDSITPFLDYPGKWVIVLARTSNAGGADFQELPLDDGRKLYEAVIQKSSTWASHERMMYVVGATQPEAMRHIRQLAPRHFFLVPGIGAQGGDLRSVLQYGSNAAGGLLINSSRGIIYASNKHDFASAAGKAAQALQQEIEKLMQW